MLDTLPALNSQAPHVDITSVDLDTLAAEVRTAHAAVDHAARNVVEHAIAAGIALLKAKAAVPHGGWLTWLKSKCDLSERHAERYMLLARNRSALEANPTRVSDLSLRGVLQLIGPPKSKTSAPTKPTEKTKPPTSFDALKWWDEATLEQRRHFIDGVGLDPLIAAIPDAWRPKF
jgi:Protein of unknown function (DUF3102)